MIGVGTLLAGAVGTKAVGGGHGLSPIAMGTGLPVMKAGGGFVGVGTFVEDLRARMATPRVETQSLLPARVVAAKAASRNGVPAVEKKTVLVQAGKIVTKPEATVAGTAKVAEKKVEVDGSDESKSGSAKNETAVVQATGDVARVGEVALKALTPEVTAGAATEPPVQIGLVETKVDATPVAGVAQGRAAKVVGVAGGVKDGRVAAAKSSPGVAVVGRQGASGDVVPKVEGVQVAAPLAEVLTGVQAVVSGVVTVTSHVVSGATSALSTTHGEGREVVQSGAPGAGGNEEMKTLVATPHVLEVGLESGTHGWLRVRAELGHGGEVVASVVASNAGAAETLKREMPGISAYLKSEAVGVSSLVVNAVEKGVGVQDAGVDAGTGTGTDSGAAPGGGQRGSGTKLPDAAADEGTGFDAGMSQGLKDVPAMVFANGSGSWLSVRV